MNFVPDWNLASIPEPNWNSENGRRKQAKRIVRRGGRNGGRPMLCGNCNESYCDGCKRRKRRKESSENMESYCLSNNKGNEKTK